MSFDRISIMLLFLASLGCSSESKCDETFSCDPQQRTANSGAGNSVLDSGLQDSGIATSSTDGSPGSSDSGVNGGSNGGNGGANGGNGGSGGVDTDAGDPCSSCTAPMAQCSPEGDCVECTGNEHCGTTAAPRCDTTSYSCSGCTAPSDCTAFAATPNCDTSSGECVQCASNDDCLNTAASLCETDNTCQPCSVDADCEHLTDTPVCDNGECVQCTGTKYEACGMLDDVPIVCDSLMRTCVSSGNLNKEHSADLCSECFSDAHCKAGQRCVMQQYDGDDVDYFCFWGQGAGSGAPDDCFTEGRPFAGELTDQTSIDDVDVTICGLRYSTCISYIEYSEKDCAPGGTPDDDLCGFNGGNDGYCRLVSGSNYRCTMLCTNQIDCDMGVTCPVGTPRLCDL
jgi:hypothetical protein